MRVALDSNILVYAAGIVKVESDRVKTALVRTIIEQLALADDVVCPWQTFGETYYVMRRFGISGVQCRTTLDEWRGRFETVASSDAAFVGAVDLATEHRLQFWDALILSVASHAGCELLLSEDLQPGFTWRGVTVVNPFAEAMDHRLAQALKAPS